MVGLHFYFVLSVWLESPHSISCSRCSLFLFAFGPRGRVISQVGFTFYRCTIACIILCFARLITCFRCFLASALDFSIAIVSFHCTLKKTSMTPRHFFLQSS